MTSRVRRFGKVSVLDLSGAIKLSGGDKTLRTTIDRLLGEGRVHLLLNLADVPLIDTLTLGEFVRTRRRAREGGGEAKLLSPAPAVRRVLEITKLDGIFDIFENEMAALASF